MASEDMALQPSLRSQASSVLGAILESLRTGFVGVASLTKTIAEGLQFLLQTAFSEAASLIQNIFFCLKMAIKKPIECAIELMLTFADASKPVIRSVGDGGKSLTEAIFNNVVHLLQIAAHSTGLAMTSATQDLNFILNETVKNLSPHVQDILIPIAKRFANQVNHFKTA